MVLEEHIYFWLLAIVPVLLLLLIAALIWKKRKQSQFADKDLLKKLSPNQSVFKTILKIVVLCLAIACLTIALVKNSSNNSRIDAGTYNIFYLQFLLQDKHQ